MLLNTVLDNGCLVVLLFSDKFFPSMPGGFMCHCILFNFSSGHEGPPLWSNGQSFWLQIQRSRVRSPALPDFLSSSGSETGSTQPREVN